MSDPAGSVPRRSRWRCSIGLVPALAPASVSAATPKLTLVGESTYDVLPDEGRVDGDRRPDRDEPPQEHRHEALLLPDRDPDRPARDVGLQAQGRVRQAQGHRREEDEDLHQPPARLRVQPRRRQVDRADADLRPEGPGRRARPARPDLVVAGVVLRVGLCHAGDAGRHGRRPVPRRLQRLDRPGPAGGADAGWDGPRALDERAAGVAARLRRRRRRRPPFRLCRDGAGDPPPERAGGGAPAGLARRSRLARPRRVHHRAGPPDPGARDRGPVAGGGARWPSTRRLSERPVATRGCTRRRTDGSRSRTRRQMA